MLNSYFSKGYTFAYATVILWAMYNVIAKVGVTFNVHPAIFVAIGMIASATALMVYAGPGRLSFQAATKPHTIFYSLLNLLEHVFTLNLFMYVASSEGSLMQRMNIAFAVLIAMFFGRRQTPTGLIGLLLVQAGVVGFITQIDSSVKTQAIAWLVVVVACQTVKTFISETHPTSNNAKDYKEHARVTAFVTFVAAFVFLFALFGAATFREFGVVDSKFAELLPVYADFFHPATFLLALVFGVLNDAPAGYCYFYATKTIKSENFFSIAAFIPMVTYAMEWVLFKFGILELKIFAPLEWTFIALIVGGSLVMSIHKAESKKVECNREEHRHAITRDRLVSTLIHFNNDIKKAAKAIEIREGDFKDIYTSKRTPTPEEMDFIRDNFENNIKDRDPVTGLDNRLTFMTQMTKLEKNDVPFSLMFIDLNKFKPVNDKYGHTIGDMVLEKIANRLEANYSHVAAISRLGGDEFCMMFFDYTKKEVEELIAEVKALISKPMHFEIADDLLAVGASIGVASYPEDGQTGQEVLEISDKFMYKDKSER